MADIDYDSPGGLFDGGGAIDLIINGGDDDTPVEVTQAVVYNELIKILQAGTFIGLDEDGNAETVTINNTRTRADIDGIVAAAIPSEVTAAYINDLINNTSSVSASVVNGFLEFTTQNFQPPVQVNTLIGGEQVIADDVVTVTVMAPDDSTITTVNTVNVTGPEGTVTVDPDDAVISDDATEVTIEIPADTVGDYNVDVSTTVEDENGNEMLDNQQVTVTAEEAIYYDVLASQPSAVSAFGESINFAGEGTITFTGGETGTAYIAIPEGRSYSIKTGIFFASTTLITGVISGFDLYSIDDYADADTGDTLILQLAET